MEMRKLGYVLLLGIGFHLNVVICMGQDFGKEFKLDFRKVGENAPVEKVFLHLDKPNYFFKDTIWIKSYAILDQHIDHFQASPSVPVYVDLIDGRSLEVIYHVVLKSENGSGAGYLPLPHDLRPGYYQVRSYTNYTLGLGEESFFTQKIWIGDYLDVPKNGPRGRSVEELNFFPEGGILVAGLPSKVAFLAKDKQGKGVQVDGMIIDHKNQPVAEFASSEAGFGVFHFHPQPNTTYRVRLISHSGNDTFEMPEIQQDGLVLNLENMEDKIGLSLSGTPGSFGAGLKLFAFSKGELVMEKQLSHFQETTEIHFKKVDLPPGLIQFLILDEEGPLLDRLCYVFPEKRHKLLPSQAAAFLPGQNAHLDFQILDEYDLPVKGEFSVSVLDKKQVFPGLPHHITAYLELASELNGSVEEFADFLAKDSQSLNDYLLTQKWRRFELLGKPGLAKTPLAYEPGLSFSGRVKRLGEESVTSIQQLLVMLMQERELPEVVQTKTDVFGNFWVEGVDFYDSTGVYFQVFREKKKEGGGYRIVKSTEVELTPRKLPPVNGEVFWKEEEEGRPLYFRDYDYLVTVKENNEYMEQFRRGQYLELGEVTVTGRRSDRLPDKRTESYGNNPRASLEVTPEYYWYPNIYQLMRSRLGGARVIGDIISLNPLPVVVLRGGGIFTGLPHSRVPTYGAQFLLNGNPAPPQLVAYLPVSEIEKIDVVNNNLINVLTRSGNPDPTVARAGMGTATAYWLGYQKPRGFFVPSKDRKELWKDYRSTLYWEPRLSTDIDGEATLNFPLGDGATEVAIIVQGLTEYGEPVYLEYEFEAKE
jgi:hypothetical protein